MIPKLTLPKVRKLIVVLTSWTFFFLLGYSIAASSVPKITINRESPKNRDLDFSLFWNIWDTLDANYYDNSQLDEANMIYGAIKGMVAAVGDPYTVFLTPRENEVTQEDLSGNFEGVGIQIGFRGQQLAVISPLPGTPAEEAGIKAGDYIVGIKDEEKDIERGTTGITLPEAVQLIRGRAGTKVNLTLLRGGSDEPIIVDVVRKSIDVPSVSLAFVGETKDIAHLRVMKFGAETKAEWDKAVLEILLHNNLSGVILDLRGNPGGYLQGAVDLSGDFMDVNELVVIEDRGNAHTEELRANGPGRLKGEKLVILADGGSASASEILAGALRENLGTDIIGMTTFGKGTIQEPMYLDSGAGLHVTIAKWLTPKGNWVNDQGLLPDVEIEDDFDTPEDEQLAKAIDYLITN
ncbi:MAG: Carboxyl-terminal protease [Candidatus Woesebacteria bacterium GW2011_GWB1_43_14]|uniref:Carboxyl-terminal protease n=1 Tax=Candidatus Woesebacteria bacterium GW2011_GWB1_43_14 TaxID=1618578 RepID=A0A0G1DH10_9BACT|nr:MAG: Carboxyl-terminal protease [Candidatus Woesebacteria bacterium GW2011_GWC1_42_9]KKS96989.1 MAG: Carboxyl-terminal protease [Candidatus Woesebacteria bacterium GW2011_GWB1_43_14]